ncbi:MAG: peptidoglycan editing factor PgeF [Thermomicrobiales bacterium]
MSFTTGAVDPDGVRANRRAALRRIARRPEDGVMCGLVHGISVRIVGNDDRGRGILSPRDAIPDTDGIITREPGLALMMCFADCVPLIVVDTQQRIIALAHAGWRGTLAGIAGALVTAMRERCGADTASLLAVIGPSIGPAVYTVGSEVVSAFTQAYPDDALFTTDERGPRLDLWEANRRQFMRAGLRADAISCAEICTFEHGARLFSHRYALAHDESEGRFAILLTMED